MIAMWGKLYQGEQDLASSRRKIPLPPQLFDGKRGNRKKRRSVVVSPADSCD